MRILDWRPSGERILTSLWPTDRQAEVRGPGLAGRLYNGLHDRLVARRVGGRLAPAARPLIISLGNLALGGTGKTPVAVALAQALAAERWRGCVLTRGFRSPLSGPLSVDADNSRAGDEARLLAAALAPWDWPVVQARDRAAGLRHALELPDDLDVVLLEDGHQTAGLGRHCDILILDHWRVDHTAQGSLLAPETGIVFPFGPWRESVSGADRADIWLVETADPVPERGVGGQAVVSFTRKLTLRAANATAGECDSPQQACLVSGIARPASFEAGAVKLLPGAVPLAVRLSDHASYGPGLVQRLVKTLSASGAEALVTTGKDWVKLAAAWPPGIPAYVVDLEIVWGAKQTLPDLIGKRLADSAERTGAAVRATGRRPSG